MKFTELNKKSESELQTMLKDLREQQRDLRFKVAADQHKNIREIRNAKKTIAQVLTALNGKKAKPGKNK